MVKLFHIVRLFSFFVFFQGGNSSDFWSQFSYRLTKNIDIWMKIRRFSFSSESLLDLTQFIDQVLSPAPPRMNPIPGMSDEEQQGEEKRNFKAGRS